MLVFCVEKMWSCFLRGCGLVVGIFVGYGSLLVVLLFLREEIGKGGFYFFFLKLIFRGVLDL